MPVEQNTNLKISRVGDSLVIRPLGEWTLKTFEKLLESLNQNIAQAKLLNLSKVEIDAADLTQFDTAGAKALISCLQNFTSQPNNSQRSNFVLNNFNPESKQLFELVAERVDKFNSSEQRSQQIHFSWLAKIGQLAFQFINYLKEIFTFIGLVSEGIFRIFLKPNLLRTKEIVTQLEDACLKSIPVVSLVTFLIGIVVTYLMAIQIEKYGGHIFVVNGVALAMCRELSPIIVAVVMAGRSGSAYTAQIGAMRLNEEVDAITALGLSPMHVLVIPRLFALVFSMPLLVFIGDLVGIGGGIIIADSYLGVTYSTFIDRLHTALPIKHFIVGMVKAPVFAAVIALIGCRRGLTTEISARSVGLSTTATVVESIVLVIILNAAFAVIFAELGI